MAFVIPRRPRDRDELHALIVALWGVALPRVGVCPEHTAPFEAVAHAFFAEDPNYAVWYASRGSGKSLALAVLGLTKALVDEVDVTIIGGSMVQSLNVRAHMADMLGKPSAPGYAIAKDLATLIQTNLGAKIEPLPASQKTVRGKHPVLELLDEVDEMDLDIYDASLGQAMEQPSKNPALGPHKLAEYVVASSTWQNPSGSFSEVIKRARDNGQPVFSWCLAAGSLVATSVGPVPIESVRPGMWALTRAGYRPVTDAWCSGVRETIRVHFDDGTSLVCTPDHLLATETGYQPAGAFRPGDRVVALTGDADPMAAVGADPDVVRVGHVVAPAAHLGALAVRPGPADVLAGGDQLEVGGVQHVDAQRDPADMVQLHARRPAADQPVVYGAVRAGGAAVEVGGDAVGTAAGVRPDDAVLGGDVELGPVDPVTFRHVVMLTPSRRQNVYDVTVAGAHEFVANGIVVHNCWRELLEEHGGWMSQRFVDAKRRTVSTQMWHTEYELNEPAATDRAIDLDKVEEAFADYGAPIHSSHKTDEHAWTWEAPAPTGIYVVGADWGKTRDKTVIATVRCDVTPRRLVRLRIANRRPWPVMIGWFNDDIKAYHAVDGKHDKTGLGSVVHDYIEDEDTSGFVFVGRERTQMLLDYITHFEHGLYTLPRRMTESAHPGLLRDDDNAELARLREAHRGVTVADVYAPGKWDSHLPDEVAAMGLAHRAAQHAGIPVVVPMLKKDPTPRAADAGFHVLPQPPSATVGVVETEPELEEGEIRLWVGDLAG